MTQRGAISVRRPRREVSLRRAWSLPTDSRFMRSTLRANGWPTYFSTRYPITPIRLQATLFGRGWVITCLGEAFPGRVAASLLRAVGLPELVTQTPREYEALARRLAQTPLELRSIRSK